MTSLQDVMLRGGPFDGTRFDAAESALVELESGGLIHRYIATSQTQQAGSETLAVYQFDGTIAPDGGMPGAEDPKNRLASPLAEELRGEDRT